VVNIGAGVFALGATVASTGTPTAIALGDIDGDLDLDVIVGRGPAVGFPPVALQPVIIRATVGPGLTYAAPAPFGTAEWVTDIRVVDIEPDGDNDLLFGTSAPGGGPPRLYLNNGAGIFFQVPPFPGASALTVDAGDLNGDGLTDLVLGSQTWLRGATTFTQYATHAAPIGLISLADLDIDGDLDLVDSAGRWYPADGLGAFGPPITIVSYAPYAPLAAAPSRFPPIDMDSDGDLDFVGGDEQLASRLSIYRNLTRHAGRTSLMSQGSVASAAIFGAPSAPWILAASAPGAPAQWLPPFGVLFLDIPSAVIVASGAIPASGRLDLSAGIPAGPGVAGLAFSWQALVGGALTNGFDTVILP
jgi:hypothetical protein